MSVLYVFPSFPQFFFTRHFQTQPSLQIDHILSVFSLCHTLLVLRDFPISISTSLTFKQCMFSNHVQCCFFLPTAELRNEPVSNGFSHSANHFYVFSKPAFPSLPLPAVSTAAPLQQQEFITMFHRKLNTRPHYISCACNESGSEKHPDIHTHMLPDVHMYKDSNAPTNASVPTLLDQVYSVLCTASLCSYIIKWAWVLLWRRCSVLDALTDCVRACNPIRIG